ACGEEPESANRGHSVGSSGISRPCHARRRTFTAASSRANLYAQVVKRLWPRKRSSFASTATSASLALCSATSSRSPPRRCGTNLALRMTSNRAARRSRACRRPIASSRSAPSDRSSSIHPSDLSPAAVLIFCALTGGRRVTCPACPPRSSQSRTASLIELVSDHTAAALTSRSSFPLRRASRRYRNEIDRDRRLRCGGAGTRHAGGSCGSSRPPDPGGLHQPEHGQARLSLQAGALHLPQARRAARRGVLRPDQGRPLAHLEQVHGAREGQERRIHGRRVPGANQAEA